MIVALGTGAACSSRAAIRVEKPREVFLHGDNAVRIRMLVSSTTGGGDETTLDIVSPGDIELSMYSNAEYFVNQAHTLVAFTTKQRNSGLIYFRVYLIAQGSGGQVLVIRNLNQRVAKLCAKEHNDQFDESSATVDKIVGNTVYMSTVSNDDSYSMCHVAVHVSSDGELSLLSYEVKKEPRFSESKVK
jgi:hypothetical protein